MFKAILIAVIVNIVMRVAFNIISEMNFENNMIPIISFVIYVIALMIFALYPTIVIISFIIYNVKSTLDPYFRTKEGEELNRSIEGLKNYLKEQLDIVIKSDDAVQQVKEVINYYNYFTSDEKIQFQQKLRTTYLYSAAKKQKLLADMYLKHQLYVRALIAYQKLETVSGKLNAAEQIQVLYHMGLCQSRMFCFEEAKESFAMATIVPASIS